MFVTTKLIHNTLQGVEKPDDVLTDEHKDVLIDWMRDNANRYWLSPGGPLRKPEEGGADVIIVSFLQLYKNRSEVQDADCSRSMTLRCRV